MTDFVDLLKMAARNGNALAGEAADEIERLRADNERLKAALNKIMRNDPEGYAPNIARRALEANDE